MQVTLLAHRGHIVVIPERVDLDPDWVPTGRRTEKLSSDREPTEHTFMGCVLLDTKRCLRASEEALALLARIPRGTDAIGDWDWWACSDGRFAASWWGPIHRLIDPSTAVTARNARVHRDQVTIVPNEIPADIAAEVDAALAEDSVSYREPSHLSDPEATA